MKKKLLVGSLIVASLTSAFCYHELTANASQQAPAEQVAIVDKMNNAIDNYGYAKGSYAYTDSNGNVQNVDFEVQEGSQPGSNIVIKDKNGNVVKNKVADNNAVLTLNDADKSYVKVPKVKDQIFEKPTVRKQVINGENYYSFRQDPASAGEANIVTLPQQLALWVTDDTSNSSIVGHETFLGRDATVLAGTVPAELQVKKGTDFKMWIDTTTGILLKFVATDANGAVTTQINVTNIEIGASKGKVFDTNVTKGYTDKSQKAQAK